MEPITMGIVLGGAELFKSSIGAIKSHKASKSAHKQAMIEYLLEQERRKKEISAAYVATEREKYETSIAAATATSAQKVEGKREAARLAAAAASAGIYNGGTAQALQAEVDAQTAIGLSNIEREKANRILQATYTFESIKTANQMPVFLNQRPKTSDLYSSLLLGGVGAAASGYAGYSSAKLASKTA